MKDQWEMTAEEGSIPEAMVQFIEQNHDATIPDLQQRFSPYMETKGDLAWILNEEYENIVLWPTCSEEFLDVIGKAIATKRIELVPTTVFLYAIDGKAIPMMEEAKRIYRYKTPRWLPTIIRRAS